MLYTGLGFSQVDVRFLPSKDMRPAAAAAVRVCLSRADGIHTCDKSRVEQPGNLLQSSAKGASTRLRTRLVIKPISQVTVFVNSTLGIVAVITLKRARLALRLHFDQPHLDE